MTLRIRSTAVAEDEFWNLSKIVAAVKSRMENSQPGMFPYEW